MTPHQKFRFGTGQTFDIFLMFFIHPQIKASDIGKVMRALIKSADLENLSKKLSSRFPGKQFIFTDMGRTAFRLIIEKWNLKNSEILFPAYICDIFYPIFRQYNIRPIFLDIDLSTFHIQTEEISKKITPRTKAIFVSHTYGLPVDIANIRKIINNQLLIIEDCAHSFGAKIEDDFTGNLGDAAIFSLYKQFPALRGGFLIINEGQGRDSPSLAKTRFDFRDFLSLVNCFSPFAYLFKKFGGEIAPKIIRKEKLLEPASINRVSLNLFSYFLKDFEKFLENRKNLALFFQKDLKKLGFEVQESKGNVFCYLSTLIPKNLKGKRDKIVQELRKYKIFCTRIWHRPIILNPEAQREYKINLNEFPNTVEAAKRIINFPLQNYYTEKDIKKMISAIKKTLKKL